MSNHEVEYYCQASEQTAADSKLPVYIIVADAVRLVFLLSMRVTGLNNEWIRARDQYGIRTMQATQPLAHKRLAGGWNPPSFLVF